MDQNFKLCFFVTNETKELIHNIYDDEVNSSQIKIISKQIDKNKITSDCFLAIVKSGTNTMQIANESIPMIIFYKFNFLTYHLLKKFLRLKPNSQIYSIFMLTRRLYLNIFTQNAMLN